MSKLHLEYLSPASLKEISAVENKYKISYYSNKIKQDDFVQFYDKSNEQLRSPVFKVDAVRDGHLELTKLNKYWVSWITGNYADEGCTNPPFKYWLTGQGQRRENLPQTFPGTNDEKDDCTLCAMIHASTEDEIWVVVKKHFPDYEKRFIELRYEHQVPNDRFPGFLEEETFLVELEKQTTR